MFFRKSNKPQQQKPTMTPPCLFTCLVSTSVLLICLHTTSGHVIHRRNTDEVILTSAGNGDPENEAAQLLEESKAM